MKIKISALFLSIIIMLTACVNVQKKAHNEETGFYPETSAVQATALETPSITHLPVLIEEKLIDINNDKKQESIKLFRLPTENNAGILDELKISIDGKEKTYPLESKLDSVKEMAFIELPNGFKAISIELFDSTNENIEVIDKYSIIIIGYFDNNITTLLDAFQQDYNSDNNYSVRYVNNFTIEFFDKFTSMCEQYELNVSDPYKDTYRKRLPEINDNNKIVISKNYYSIKVEDTDSDGISEIICSKYIPGIYHNHTLGLIDYFFKLNENRYNLEKQILRTDEMFGGQLIKETIIK